MTRLFSWSLALAMLVPSAFGGTAMILAQQSLSPVQLTMSRHGLSDALEEATFRNQSSRTISAYRIGWVIVESKKAIFKSGVWMNIPKGILPGANQSVPAQGIPLARQAQEMIFFVSDVRFADGSHWTADRRVLLRH